VQGGPVRQVRIDVDPTRLEAFNLSLDQLVQAVQAANQNIPAGNIRMGRLDYNLRIEGEIQAPELFGRIVVGQQQGRLVYLSDVASVYDGMRERTLVETINRQDGVRIVVQKQANANTVAVARDVNAVLPELQRQLPADVRLGQIVDTSEFILNAITNLGQVLVFGGLFIILVVLFFLKRWRSTFIIVLTIPFSLIVALIYLYSSGNSLNMISLSSLAIAMGMVVDDAIVILENITTYIERGSRPREAAIFGTNEVGLAVIATTLTIVAVFLPMTFLTGMAGVLFHQLGIIVTLTVVTSTVAALTLTPMLGSKLLTAQKKTRSNRFWQKFDATTERMFRSWENGYARALAGVLAYRKTTIFASFAIFGITLLLVPRIGTEFIAESDTGRLTIAVELEAGRRMEESLQVANRIENFLYDTYGEQLTVLSTSVGSPEGGIRLGGAQQAPHIINLTIGFVNQTQRARSIFAISEEIRENIYQIPGVVNLSIGTGGGIGTMFGQTGKPFELRVLGPDEAIAAAVADSILNLMGAVPGTRDVESSRGANRPQLKIVLDRERMALHGVNTATVGNAVRNRIAGVTATQYREAGNEYDVFVRYMPEFRTSITHVENILLTGQTGQQVRLREVGQVQEEHAPLAIERLNRERAITLSAGLFGRSLGEVTNDIQERIDRMGLPPGIALEYGGQVESQQDAFGDLFLLLLLSVMLVFMVMASQFESLVDPFIIMFSLPFAFSGVLLALFFLNTPLGIMSFVGGIILIGIVVKNAIVLVDFINLTRARGQDMTEAILVAGRSRLRPVLMTTFTTILAMLPLALSFGEGSEIWQPMGIAVTGGLIFSTLVTLLLVPVLYAILKKGKGPENVKILQQINHKAA
jgi:hydrophobic/amphiphilic exporter-1 (mainly G- bacteria), HAE1 family